MKCPRHSLRTELPPLPERMKKLPVDARGYPVPYFVAWVGADLKQCPRGHGAPEFRMMDARAMREAVRFRLCWVCGEEMGRHMAFVSGPMCAVTRTSSEPPSHLDCALFSARACPFLSRPNMVRREDEFTDTHRDNVAGMGIRRNPGVAVVWVTKGYKIFPDPKGKTLFEMGEPESISWWREGRTATRAEILDSINSGLPALEAMCPPGTDDLADLHRRRDELITRHVPTH